MTKALHSDVMPCSLVNRFQQNVTKYLPNYTAHVLLDDDSLHSECWSETSKELKIGLYGEDNIRTDITGIDCECAGFSWLRMRSSDRIL
jgi:hypothetical protein